MNNPPGRTSVLLLSALLILGITVRGVPASDSAANSVVSNSGATNEVLIRGKTPDSKEQDALMKALNRQRTRTYRARRFEIVFFVSLPVTLWLTWSLMEWWIRNTNDVNNPDKEFQSPHYIFMFSTSLITSFYVAAQDYKRYGVEPSSGVREKKVTLPILGIRF